MSRCQEAISPSPPSFPGHSSGAGGAPTPRAPTPAGGDGKGPALPLPPAGLLGLGLGTGMGMGTGSAGFGGNLLLLPPGREQSLVLARRELSRAPEGLLPPLQAPCEAPREKPAVCRTALCSWEC